MAPSMPLKYRIQIGLFNFLTGRAIARDNTVNRRFLSLFETLVPADPVPKSGVCSADAIIDTTRDLFVRIFVPSTDQDTTEKLPLVVYFHGGGFAFAEPHMGMYDHWCHRMCSRLHAVIASVNYRCSPEHRCPTPYNDGVDVLRFLDSGGLRSVDILSEIDVDLGSCFLAGDTAGGNIVHHVARRWAATVDSWGKEQYHSCRCSVARREPMDILVAQALFGDDAGAVIVGSDPDMSVERPLYEIVSTGQSIIPGTEDTLGGCVAVWLCGCVAEAGFVMFLAPTVPMHVTNNIKVCLSKLMEPLGISDYNSLFYILHPGGQKILDEIETELKLEKEKILSTRHVLVEFGNIMSGSVIFVMDEMRKRSRKERMATTGEGAEFGVLLGFGPGLTIETAILRAIAIPI